MFASMLMSESLIKLFSFSLFLFYTVSLQSIEIYEKVLICGVCRNIETRLEKTKIIMESVGQLFEDYRILVYENNSTDNTSSLLKSWADSNSKVQIKSETLSKEALKKTIVNIHSDGHLFIPEEISRARNIVLEEALSDCYENFHYIIWIDMDFVRFPDLTGFIDTFYSSCEWDAVLAYGIAPDNTYWDWYAFRDTTYPFGPELIGYDWWEMDKRFSLSLDDSWYKVYSAFGGCGIYKKSSIQGCRYSALVSNDLEIHIKHLLEEKNHKEIIKYLEFNRHLDSLHLIETIKSDLPLIENRNIGVILNDRPDAIIWRMNSFVYQYPVICEHVPFHASMIIRGHDKIYINPKLVFRYGN